MSFAGATEWKASNAGTPHESMPWSLLKQELQESSNHGDTSVHEAESDFNRRFELDDDADVSTTKLAEFETNKDSKKLKLDEKVMLEEEEEKESEMRETGEDGVNNLTSQHGKVKSEADYGDNVCESSGGDFIKLKRKEQAKTEEFRDCVSVESSDDEGGNVEEESDFQNVNDDADEFSSRKRKKNQETEGFKVSNQNNKPAKIARIDRKRERNLKRRERRKRKKNMKNNSGNMGKEECRPVSRKEQLRVKNKGKLSTISINGREIKVAKFNGFPVKEEDAVRLKKLQVEMIAKGVPHDEMKAALKLKRRRAEKELAREKKKVCLKCRKAGHLYSDCPEVAQENYAVGICFKCGSTEHRSLQCKVSNDDKFKYAKCFVCGEEGHISKQCPDNPKGLYPQGGACKMCGDVHLKKQCPQLIKKKRSARGYFRYHNSVEASENAPKYVLKS